MGGRCSKMASGMENYLVGKKKMTLLAWGEGFPGVARPASQCFNGQNSPAPGEPLEN